jgi:hypothetical protein
MNQVTIKYIRGSNSTTPCIVWAPDDWDPNSSRKYPLIIAYHGEEAAINYSGVSGPQGLSALLQNGILVDLNKGEKAQTIFGGQLVKFVVVSPQASTYTPDTTWFNPNFNDITKRLLVGVGGLVKIDSTRVYVTGYSAGGKPTIGNTCLSTSDSIYSRLVAAAVPMSPATQDINFPKLYLAERRGIHFLGFVGGSDPTYIPGLQRVQETIQKYNSSLFPIADIIPGNAHCCFDQYWDTGYAVPGFGKNIYQWLMLWQRGTNTSPPVVNAGMNQAITLPASQITLSGTAQAGSSSIISTSWSELSGPNNAVIASPSSLSTALSNLIQGTYVLQLSATDSLGLTASSAVQIIVQVPVPPSASAGGNQTILLPTNAVTLNGTDGKGTGGPIISTQWTQRSGPAGASLSAPNTLITLVSGLLAGTYVFRLTVKDSLGNSSFDSSTVTVYSPNGNSVNVRIYAGTAPYTNPLWNNWNLGNGAITNKSSGALKYSDGTSSSITALLSYQDALADNGIGYAHGASMCPDSVLRFTSYSTSTRTIAIGGLNNSNKYNLSFYASRMRTDGQKTTFTVGSQAITVLTDNNTSSPASFSSISPSGGQILVTITRNSTYNYLNGFSVTVNITNVGPNVTAGTNQTINLPVNSVILTGTAIPGSSRIVSNLWSELSGPGTAILSSASQLSTPVTSLQQGVYLFKLTATDSLGLAASATIQVTVLPAPVPPAVNAGNNLSITLPVNSVGLVGSAIPGSSRILSTIWTQSSGPGPANIASASQLSSLVTNLIQGIYVFKLTALDSAGFTSSSTVSITVQPAPIPPGVNAGLNQSINYPQNVVQLNGTVTAGSSKIASIGWTQTNGPPGALILFPGSQSTEVSNLVPGTYIFQLSATDSLGLGNQANTQVIVLPPNPPIVSAGINQSLSFPADSLLLSGTVIPGSSSIVSISWVMQSGPNTAGLSNPQALSTLALGLVPGTYLFQLSATDSLALTASSSVQITVLGPKGPGASAGNSQILGFPQNTTLLVGTDTAGNSPVVSVRWSQLSGPNASLLSNPDSLVSGLSNLVPGTYAYNLAVTDSLGLTASSNLLVTVLSPLPPHAGAGDQQTIAFPINNATLLGADSAGTSRIVLTSWTQIGGPNTAGIGNPDSLVTTITGLIPGTYSFLLTVTDSLGLTATTTTQILVNPPFPPRGGAGQTQTLVYPVNSIGLSGTDTAGSSPVYSTVWSEQNGPNSAGLVNPDSLACLATGLVPGSYSFVLIVTDSLGLVASSSIQITVLPALPPRAGAGNAIHLVFPSNNLVLAGIDTAGSSPIESVFWTELNGPSSANLTNSDSLNCLASGLAPGIYSFNLTVTDSLGLSATASVQIEVLPPLPPRVHAGANQTLVFPINSTTLTGSDTSGSSPLINTGWIQSAGPDPASFTNPANTITTVSGLVPGTYSFTFYGIDSLGLTDSGTTQVIVKPPVPPSVSTGANLTITLPADSTSLDGVVTAGSSSVVSVSWSQISGPGLASILSPNSPTTTVSNLQQGSYLFRLTAKDSLGESALDSSSVAVLAAPPSTVNVRIYGGTAPFKNIQWNNWNVGTGARSNISSGALKYSDGSSSTIGAVLSYQDNLADNGVGYTKGAAMCPDTVLRFSSYTSSIRNLTISGLNSSKKYNLTFYASRMRNDGQMTTFTIGSQSVKVLTDNNSSTPANFASVTSSSGTIMVGIARSSIYNYLNGFTITEITGLAPSDISPAQELSIDQVGSDTSGSLDEVIIYPNPAADHFNILNGGTDPLSIQLYDIQGRRLLLFRGKVSTETLDVRHLARGTYVVVVRNERTGKVYRQMLLKN